MFIIIYNSIIILLNIIPLSLYLYGLVLNKLSLYIIYHLMFILLNIVPIILSVAFFTLAERKVMAAVQRRNGPDIVGFWGILQPFADAIKLIVKEFIFPSKVYGFLFFVAPLLALFLGLCGWGVMPFSFSSVHSNPSLSLLYIFMISGLNVYSVIIAGWSSNSRYAFLGSLRSAAQMISYEVSLGFILLTVVICAGSLNLIEIVYIQKFTNFFFFGLFPSAVLFFIIILAETNRAPFDLPEAEAELVAGFNVEYSSLAFALFFLGEYCNMVLMSALYSILFFGGWLPGYILDWVILQYIDVDIPPEVHLAIKTVLVCFFFIFIRANFPRFRYDQLMYVGWKVLLPLNFSFFFLVTCLLVFFDGLPAGVLWYTCGIVF